MIQKLRIDPNQQCECPGPRDERMPDNRRTGTFYFRREACGLCGCFIVTSRSEIRALKVRAIEAEVRERGVWPSGRRPVHDSEFAYEWIVARLREEPTLTQGQLRFDFCEVGLFAASDSVFERLVRRARDELGIVVERGNRRAVA